MAIGGVVALLSTGCMFEGDDPVEGTAGASATAGDTDPGGTSGDDGTSGATSDTSVSASDSASSTAPTGTETGGTTDTTGEGTTGEEPMSYAPDCEPLDVAFADAMALEVHTVTFDLTHNDGDYAGSGLDNGYIYLVNEVTGDRARIGQVKTKKLVAPVLAGVYSIVYEAAASTMTMPRNASVVLEEGLAVFTDVSRTVDIPSVDVKLTLKLDGKEPTPSPVDSARIFVTQGGPEGERTYIGSTAQSGGKFSAPLVPGDYEVFYESERRGAGLPINALAKIAEQRSLSIEPTVAYPVESESIESPLWGRAGPRFCSVAI